MDFFKSVFSDDPDPNAHKPTSDSREIDENEANDDDPDPNSSPNTQSSNPNSTATDSGTWSFGGLIKTLSTKSESVIETYRRDLKEFGSGLRQETATLREIASRAVKELPTSIEAGASAIDELGSSVWKGTAQIISQGKEAILTVDQESDSLNSQGYSSSSHSSKHYSRFDARVRAIQCDLSTYCDEPEDLNDYNKWKLGFVLEEKSEETERLFEENVAMEEIYGRVVPSEVDRETFWCRYFYRVYKLKQVEDVRASLVKRAIAEEDEEDLSWDDVDDDDDAESNVVLRGKLVESKEIVGKDSGKIVKEDDSVEESRIGGSGVVDEKDENMFNVEVANDEGKTNVSTEVDSSEKKYVGDQDSAHGVEKGDSVEELRDESPGDVDKKGENVVNVETGAKGIVEELSSDSVLDKKMQSEGKSELKKDELVSKSDEKVGVEGKVPVAESSKDSDFTVVPGKPSLPEEEDLGWDEIEDLSSIDEKKVTHGGSPSRADLRKRLNAADEEEDLSWDIEDDDEPTRA